MAFSDDLADLVTAHVITLERLKSGEKAAVIKLLRKLEKDLAAEVLGIDPTGTQSSAYHQARLVKLLASAKQVIKDSYAEIKDYHLAQLNDLAAIEEKFAKDSINGLIGVDIMTVSQSPEGLAAIASDTLIEKAPSAEWWGRQAGDTLQKFSDEMRAGVFRGESVGELVSRVRGTKANNYADAIMERGPYRNAEALVRTSVQTVANEARLQTYANNADVIKGYQWVATLDSRTTKICIALDGCTWDKDFKPTGRVQKVYPGPTAHWGCRSVTIPVLKSWAELADEAAIATGGRPTTLPNRIDASDDLSTGDASALKGQLRASMDGQVADVNSFDQWLTRKDASNPQYVDNLLGPGRAELWRQGKISANDLTNQDNRPLTIAQLKGD